MKSMISNALFMIIGAIWLLVEGLFSFVLEIAWAIAKMPFVLAFVLIQLIFMPFFLMAAGLCRKQELCEAKRVVRSIVNP